MTTKQTAKLINPRMNVAPGIGYSSGDNIADGIIYFLSSKDGEAIMDSGEVVNNAEGVKFLLTFKSKRNAYGRETDRLRSRYDCFHGMTVA